MDDTIKQLKNYYDNLLPSLKTLVGDRNTFVIVEKIAKDNGVLSEENIASFKNETLFVLLGIEALSNYEKNLSINLTVISPTIKKLVSEVQEKIFSKVQEDLTSIQEGTETEKKNIETKETQPVKLDLTELEAPASEKLLMAGVEENDNLKKIDESEMLIPPKATDDESEGGIEIERNGHKEMEENTANQITENVIKRSDILSIVENPTKQNTGIIKEPFITMGDIAGKLTSVVSIPQEKEHIVLKPSDTTKKPLSTQIPLKQSYPKGGDPYREPVE